MYSSFFDFSKHILYLLQQHPILGLLLLFITCLLSATILPLPSEAALILYIKKYSGYKLYALLSASLGNTLGGIISFYMGFILYKQVLKYRRKHNLQAISIKANNLRNSKYLPYIKKYGSIILLLSWVPFIGDILCLAAGYLRINLYPSIIYMFIGKFIRYAIIIGIINIL